MNYLIPQKIYEILRWILAIVSPAAMTLLVTLNSLWQWNLPIEAITGTIAAITLFLGVIFGISKIVKDNNTTTAG